jgi:hypothetical protein
VCYLTAGSQLYLLEAQGLQEVAVKQSCCGCVALSSFNQRSSEWFQQPHQGGTHCFAFVVRVSLHALLLACCCCFDIVLAVHAPWGDPIAARV